MVDVAYKHQSCNWSTDDFKEYDISFKETYIVMPREELFWGKYGYT